MDSWNIHAWIRSLGCVPYICCQVPKVVKESNTQKIAGVKLKINEFFSENTFINLMRMKAVFMVL